MAEKEGGRKSPNSLVKGIGLIVWVYRAESMVERLIETEAFALNGFGEDAIPMKV